MKRLVAAVVTSALLGACGTSAALPATTTPSVSGSIAAVPTSTATPPPLSQVEYCDLVTASWAARQGFALTLDPQATGSGDAVTIRARGIPSGSYQVTVAAPETDNTSLNRAPIECARQTVR